MANPFRTRAIRIRPLDRLWPLIALLLALSGHAGAAELLPFSATYRIEAFGLNATGTRVLARLDDATWRLSQDSKVLFFSASERSTLKTGNGSVCPVHYEYDQSPGGSDQDVEFNWNKGLAVNRKRDDPWRLELQPGLQDKLSYQLQVQLDFLNGVFDKSRDYQVVDKGDIRTYRIELVGEETMKTAAGESLRTLKLYRYKPGKTHGIHFWVAPDYNYLLVKLVQDDDDGKSSLHLKSATVGGRQLSL